MLWEKHEPHRWSISQVFDCERCVYLNGSQGLFPQKPFPGNALTSPKNSWNVQKSTFVLLFHYPEPNWVRKSYFQSDMTFQGCLVIRWLPTTSILVVTERIYRCQFKSNYLKDHKFFWNSFCNFGIFIKVLMLSKQHESIRSSISQVIDSERCVYLNGSQGLFP